MMRPVTRIASRPAGGRGSVLVEGLLALVVFSVGLVALLLLLSAALRETGNARYRSEASLLASDLVASMWTGDRSQAALQSRFANPKSAEYSGWLARVQATLPGVSAAGNQPHLEIGPGRTVTLRLRWQPPGEPDVHQLVVQTVISD